ncbi:MAG: aldehyde dehydrogenase family protein [Desulfobacterales bacterium]
MTQGFDKDLTSIQEARRLVESCFAAQQQFIDFSQEQVDRICKAMAEAAHQAAERLGRLAAEETTYGVPRHKTLKNQLASRGVWDSIRDIPTVGVVREDKAKGIVEIGWPMGVVAALSPSTNPTSTLIHNTLIAVKARNGIVNAPHPSAWRCCGEATRVLAEAGEAAGMPSGLVSCMAAISLPGTQELMRHAKTAVILATGGSDMVRAAHSMGKPAYGVGPGNVPCYVDRSADVQTAASLIVSSKAFDNSVICATEQAVVADRPIATALRAAMERLGAYFVDPAQAGALGRVLFFANGVINPRSVGQTPQTLARMADIHIPEGARILVAPLSRVGAEEPLSREKLTTVLGWYEADGWQAGCDRCMEMILFGGRGHSLVIHAADEAVVMAFGLKKPVFRLLVNTMGTLGSVGVTSGLMPALTLGSGAIGGAISGDNITTTHLLNIKRIAHQIKSPPAQAMVDGAALPPGVNDLDPAELKAIVRAVIEELARHGESA